MTDIDNKEKDPLLDLVEENKEEEKTYYGLPRVAFIGNIIKRGPNWVYVVFDKKLYPKNTEPAKALIGVPKRLDPNVQGAEDYVLGDVLKDGCKYSFVCDADITMDKTNQVSIKFWLVKFRRLEE